FEESCLVKTGLVISLGHNRNSCPCQDYDKQITTIVDKSGVHTHKIKYCRCADAPTTDIQLCQIGLFPASFAQPKTAFTF
ncbi:hypothetical protein EV424DRAFT_1331573, partial [Suillus variegatus]